MIPEEREDREEGEENELKPEPAESNAKFQGGSHKQYTLSR